MKYLIILLLLLSCSQKEQLIGLDIPVNNTPNKIIVKDHSSAIVIYIASNGVDTIRIDSTGIIID